MTETATALAAISVALLLHGRTTTAHPTDRRWSFLIGAVCGIAMLMRLTNILLAAAAAVALLFDPRQRSSRWRSSLPLAGGPALAIVAHAALNAAMFESMVRTGYHYWVPSWHTSLSKTFSLTYALYEPGHAAVFDGTPNALYYAGFLLLRISSPWFVLAAAWGALVLWRSHAFKGRIVVAYTGVLAGSVLVVYSLYYVQDGRFMAPLVGLTAVLTGVGVARALQLIGARRTARLRASVAGGLTCLAFAIGVILDMRPSAARTYAGQRLARRATESPTPQPLSATSAAYDTMTRQGDVVVTAVPVTLLNSLSARGVRVVGLGRTGYWATPPLAHVPVFSEQRDELERLIRAGGSAYIDAYSVGLLQTDERYAGVRDAFTRFRLVPVHSTRDAIVYALKAS